MAPDARTSPSPRAGAWAAVGLLAIAINALFWAAAPVLQQTRALVNVDYALLAALALVVPAPPVVFGALFALVALVDAWMAYSALYLPRPWLVLDGVETVLLQSPGVALAIGCALALVGVGAAWTLRVARGPASRRPLLLGLGAFVGLVALGDFANGTVGDAAVGRAATIADNVGTSGALRFVRVLIAGARLPTPVAIPLTRAEFASSALPAQDARTLAELPHVTLLVLVESWGALRDPALAQQLAAPVLRAAEASGYGVQQGTVSAGGGTLGGEFRELCGVRFRDVGVDSALVEHCLPRRLRRLGVHTVSMHAYAPRLYGRVAWYDPVGFTERLFADSLTVPGASRCGVTLRGPCDWDVATLVDARLTRAERDSVPSFLYWLTLSGHLPVLAVGTSATSCSDAAALREDPLLCGWFTVTARTLASVGGLLRAHRGLSVLLVGDHEPPFGRGTAAGAFVPGRVPYLVLTPAASADSGARKASPPTSSRPR